MTTWQQQQAVAENTSNRVTQIYNEAEVDRATLLERQKTAKLAARSKVAVPNRTLRMASYIYTQGTPPPQISTKGYLSSDKIQIYDSTGVCIGLISNRQFTFIDEKSDICDNPPIVNVN